MDRFMYRNKKSYVVICWKKKCAEGDHISLNMIKYSFKLKYSSQRKNIECNEIIKLIS